MFHIAEKVNTKSPLQKRVCGKGDAETDLRKICCGKELAKRLKLQRETEVAKKTDLHKFVLWKELS